MFLYMFLEKIVLKDVSSNDADLVRDLRFILIAAQKNYVLEALWCRLKICRYFPKEEGMMQHIGGKVYPWDMKPRLSIQ